MQLNLFQKLFIKLVMCMVSLYFLFTAFEASQMHELCIRGVLYQAETDPLSYWFFVLMHIVLGLWPIFLLLNPDESKETSKPD
jgi:hypothetical protein